MQFSLASGRARRYDAAEPHSRLGASFPKLSERTSFRPALRLNDTRRCTAAPPAASPDARKELNSLADARLSLLSLVADAPASEDERGALQKPLMMSKMWTATRLSPKAETLAKSRVGEVSQVTQVTRGQLRRPPFTLQSLV